MNDDWSRCPICFEDYSLEHRPTTFVCGHSTCIDHTAGLNRIRECPICRYRLRENNEYHVSYNLEEASRIFQLIKDSIDWSVVKLPPAPAVRLEADRSQTTTSSTPDNDENYARQLQARFDREQQRTAQAPRVLNRPQPQPQAAARINPHAGQQKNCGHACCLTTTTRCCPCSDRRPQHPNGLYESYVDGRGFANTAARNEHYCPVCKRRA